MKYEERNEVINDRMVLVEMENAYRLNREMKRIGVPPNFNTH